MITSAGWFDWAERLDGPPEKVYSERCRSRGVVAHSAVGFYETGWLDRLFDMSRLPGGRFTEYAAASVTGFIRFDGTLVQHYPIFASCWASGSREANVRYNAFELEGGFPWNQEPLRPAQTATLARAIRDLSDFGAWTPNRAPVWMERTLWEHRECVAVYGGASTSCPDDRIPWETVLSLSTGQEDDVKPYLITEEGSAYVWIAFGNVYTYLHDFAHADALGIPRDIKRVPRGTLASMTRLG